MFMSRWAIAAGLLVVSAAAAGVFWNRARAAPEQSAEALVAVRRDAETLTPEVPKAPMAARDASADLEAALEGRFDNSAIGVGELRIYSGLNQPFYAEIQLTLPNAELAEFKVALATDEVFDRVGLDRPAYLSDFAFDVTRNRDGRPVIKVTSSRAVTEPFVSLLLEGVSRRGRLIMEYTVLLDPPGILFRDR